ncbi:hypothetical protein [Neobacillus massiliamazoniensis]|uniref:Uncharacterized protein n=1 Tax=Neobacillus massiliamazoniensis TaxID=1499688 RepID=A0A0U1NZE9_9BACI|nr:hypothetical protein [Neobacillus massiliamazoniensis]CRK83212.1 hypothetical protein BN000_03172 [Neobacillus massiliamazoniensis]
MPERTSTTKSPVVSVDERRSGRVKSPFLREKTTRTTPRTSPSLYTKELFKRSDEAVGRLKNSRLG